MASVVIEQPLTLYTLFAHVHAAAGLGLGSQVRAPGRPVPTDEEPAAEVVASVAPSQSLAPPHAHVSVLLAKWDFPWGKVTGWPDLLARSGVGEIAFVSPPVPFRRLESMLNVDRSTR